MSNITPKEKTYFKGLNGIRAIAAIGVVFGHTASMLNQFPRYAVIVFFTLSGFLITYLLLTEQDITNRINFRNFYMRRILRIWPVYFFFIIAVLLVHTFIIKDGVANARNLPYYFVFFPNYPVTFLKQAPTDMAHLWSIGIEEQFYLFWPFVLQYIKNKKRFLFIFIVSIIIVRTLIKIYCDKTGNINLFYFAESCRFDCMAIGALFAIYYKQKNGFLLHHCKSLFIPIAFWSFVFLASFYRFNFFSIYTDNVVSLIAAAFIINQITSVRKKSILENPPMFFLGKISYGIYVYHPLFISLSIFVFNAYGIVPRHRLLLPTVVVLTILISFLSYTFLEKPFLRKKKTFEVLK